MSRRPRPSPPPSSTATPMIFVTNEERSLVRKEKDLKQNQRIFGKKRRVSGFE
ncbi:beta-glucosidase [Sesbania bispinosa]|nr:beta-glucosidase [Sesbania bispinosa]